MDWLPRAKSLSVRDGTCDCAAAVGTSNSPVVALKIKLFLIKKKTFTSPACGLVMIGPFPYRL